MMPMTNWLGNWWRILSQRTWLLVCSCAMRGGNRWKLMHGINALYRLGIFWPLIRRFLGRVAGHFEAAQDPQKNFVVPARGAVSSRSLRSQLLKSFFFGLRATFVTFCVPFVSSFCFLDDFQVLELWGWTAENADARKPPHKWQGHFSLAPGCPIGCPWAKSWRILRVRRSAASPKKLLLGLETYRTLQDMNRCLRLSILIHLTWSLTTMLPLDWL